MKSFALLLSMIPIFFFFFFSTANAVQFICNATAAATCQALAGYIPPNSTTYKDIQSFFQVASLLSLLAANSLPSTTPSSQPVIANSTVLIPFPCICSNGIGVSNRIPVYTVKPADQGLDAIARNTFEQFVTFTDIATFNNIPNVDLIKPGEKLWIPLPCSCDPVGGEDVVHLGHVVAAGSSVAGIAAEFGTDEKTVLQLNGISDPKKLQAGQVLDVPLKACSSSISSKSLDHNLRIPNGSYALTAENCIKCSCSSSSNYQLSCNPIQGLNTSVCPVPKCKDGDLYVGNTTTSGCELKTCAYTGYTNSSGMNIMSSLITQSTCNNGGEPAAQPSSNSPPTGSSAGRLSLQGNWIELLVFIQMVYFFCFGFLA